MGAARGCANGDGARRTGGPTLRPEQRGARCVERCPPHQVRQIFHERIHDRVDINLNAHVAVIASHNFIVYVNDSFAARALDMSN
ncbi:Hypothetical protein A7982_04141 [Minicystis rosea]|nr:Hypothetical protein A7982_04141 [Minicystis rosea]